MSFNWLTISLVSALVLFCGSSNAGPIIPSQRSQENVTLKEVGTSMEKVISSKRHKGTWEEAKELAQSVNMTLGEFANFEESDFLASLRDLPTDGFWTGGRDSQQERQFSWDSNGLPFVEQSFRVIYTPYILTCIMFFPYFCSGHFCLGPMVTSYPCEATMFVLLQQQK